MDVHDRMMAMIEDYQTYRIGSESGLTLIQKKQLADCFDKPPQQPREVLGGRVAVVVQELAGVGPVVVKRYARGGLIRYVNRYTYLNLSVFRCQAEFEILLFLRRSGVSVPEPVAFASRGSLFYHAWLVTRAIDNTMTLAELAKASPDRAKAAMEKVGQQVALLVDHRVHHIDLHPGNVLVDRDNRVHLIDFDKARITQENKDSLRQRYIMRWQRAMDKHGLPAFLGNLAIVGYSR